MGDAIPGNRATTCSRNGALPGDLTGRPPFGRLRMTTLAGKHQRDD